MLTFLKALSPEFRPTIRLALPLVIAEVGWMTMGIVDTIMVGRLPNSAVAIGATGLGQSLYHSVVIFGGGLLLGMDTLVSHAYGREDHRDARASIARRLVGKDDMDAATADGILRLALAAMDRFAQGVRPARRIEGAVDRRAPGCRIRVRPPTIARSYDESGAMV